MTTTTCKHLGERAVIRAPDPHPEDEVAVGEDTRRSSPGTRSRWRPRSGMRWHRHATRVVAESAVQS